MAAKKTPKPPAADKAATDKAATDKAAAEKEAAKKAADDQARIATVPALSVQSAREGFRRAGRAWSKEATVVVLSELSEEQIDQIKNETVLTVTEVEIPAQEAAE